MKSPYEYLLKKRTTQPLEEYVSGNMRFYFIKHAVVDKEEDSTPIIYEQRRHLVQDNTKSPLAQLNEPNLLGKPSDTNLKVSTSESPPMKEIITTTRSIGCQTLMRESEAQTIPAPFGVVKQDNTFQEIFELKDFHFGSGLPVEMHDIELIAKAREKRAFNDALPPLSDEANFNLRNKLTNEQETREWKQKEKEIEEINEKRLLTLQQFLENREKNNEIKRLEKIDRLKEKKDEEVEAAIIKSRKRRVKIIRNISKMKEKFTNNNNRQRDIILDYASFGSKVYAPLTRDGHNPDRHPFKFELNSYSLNTYDGLTEIGNEVVSTQNSSLANITKPKMEKQFNNSLSKLEKVHIKAIKDAFSSIQRQEIKKKEEEEIKKKKYEEESRNKIEQNKKVEEPVEKNLILEDVLLFQRLLRGRKEQIEMQEGRKKRAELIKELKQADEWKSSAATAEEQKLIDNYKEKLTNGVVDAIQGDNISKTLDFLSKEMVRIKEEQKINAIVMMAENERRKREAEEMGRRQAENILRDRQDIMSKELQEVNQATMDSYINSLFTNTVNKVSKKQVIKEIEIKANKLNKIVDKIEDKFVKDDVRIRDLVSSFIIPEIERKKKQDQIELEEKRFIERAKVAINTSLRNAENEYGKKDEIKEENDEDEEEEKEEDKKDEEIVNNEMKKQVIEQIKEEEHDKEEEKKEEEKKEDEKKEDEKVEEEKEEKKLDIIPKEESKEESKTTVVKEVVTTTVIKKTVVTEEIKEEKIEEMKEEEVKEDKKEEVQEENKDEIKEEEIKEEKKEEAKEELKEDSPKEEVKEQ